MSNDNKVATSAIVGLEKPSDQADSVAEHKARLLRQADFYRAGIVHAKASIQYGARPEVMFHTAIDHATWAIRARVDSLLRPTGVSVASLMPYAVTVLGFLRRRKLVKPALGVTAVVAGVVYYLQQRRLHQAR